jgi:hypothetical protein
MWLTSGVGTIACFCSVLHIDALGIGRDFCGAMIDDLKAHGELPGADVSIALALRSLWLERRDWCKATGRDMFRGPCFKKANTCQERKAREYRVLGTIYKGTTVLNICKFLAEELSQARRTDDHSKLRATCGYYYALWHHVLDTSGDVLTLEQAEVAHRAGSRFLQCWQALANEAALDFRFKIRCKHHMFDHVVWQLKAGRWNPKRNACWIDESFLGVLKGIGKRTHGGTTMLRVLQRYLLFIAVHFEERRQKGFFAI